MNKKEERLVSIDLLRVIAIVLIIGFHLVYNFNHDSSIRPVGFLGVSLFFIISGFMLAKKYPLLEKFSAPWFLKRYIRIASLYYLALIFLVFLFGKQIIRGQW